MFLTVCRSTLSIRALYYDVSGSFKGKTTHTFNIKEALRILSAPLLPPRALKQRILTLFNAGMRLVCFMLAGGGDVCSGSITLPSRRGWVGGPRQIKRFTGVQTPVIPLCSVSLMHLIPRPELISVISVSSSKRLAAPASFMIPARP